MRGVGESKSKTSLYDFFDDRKNHKNTTDKCPDNVGTSEEAPKQLIKETVYGGDAAEVEPIAGTSKSTPCHDSPILPSASETVLLDHVLEKENSTLRSKTSEEQEEKMDMGRKVRSDIACPPAGYYADYPDIHGAGDSHGYVLVPRDSSEDDGVQIDMVVDSDRTTADTDILQSAAGNVDALVSDREDRPTPSARNEKSDTDSDSEVVPKDLAYIYEEDSDSDDTEAELESAKYCKTPEDGAYVMKAVDPDTDDARSITYSGSSISSASEYASDFDKYDHANDDNRPLKDVGDHRKSDNESNQDQYTPCSDEDNASSSQASAESVRHSETFADCEMDCDEPQNGDVDEDAVSGTRETFTPFLEPVNDDEPGEGNRQASNGDVDRELNTFHTRVNKTDGEGIMNVPLSRSFIGRHRDACISDGADTIGELIMALQRRRIMEMAQVEDEVDEGTLEAYEASIVAENGQGGQDDGQSLEKSLGDSGSSSNDYKSFEDEQLSPRRNRLDRGLSQEKTAGEEGLSKTESETDSVKTLEPTSTNILQQRQEENEETTEPKKTIAKKDTPQVTKTKMNSKAVNRTERGKQSLNCMPVNVKTKSAVQTRISDQYAPRNLRKGSKPVLPSIAKGTSKSAGQTLTTDVDTKIKTESQYQREQLQGTSNQILGDITVGVSPTILTPRKAAVPQIPIQLRSNACFRNGQLEVEVTCDDRLYASADPMNVKVTFVHKHVQLNKGNKCTKASTKPSAYKAKTGKKSDRLLNALYPPMNRNIIHQRAQWPPFNTHIDPEASARHKKMFGSL